MKTIMHELREIPDVIDVSVRDDDRVDFFWTDRQRYAV